MIRKILLAEDDRTSAHMMKRQLERFGFEVDLAGNGREALEILRVKHVDLIITDVVMPEMDGVDLYLALKKNPATAALPVIIVTDKQMFQDSFASLGVDHFVSKLSDFSVLLAKIREISDLGTAAKRYNKVLIGSQETYVMERMQLILLERDCLVTLVEKPMDIVSKAIMMMPNIIFLDVMVQGDIAASEIVNSLRCYDRLKHAAIVTFAYISAHEAANVRDIGEIMKSRAAACDKAGATRFLGLYTESEFQDCLQELGVAG